MKKTLFYSGMLMTAAVVALAPTAEASFKDVKPNSEQEVAIQSLLDRNIVSGYTDGTFRPVQAVTRAQAAKILAGVLNLDVENVKNPGFSDVPTSHPSYKYIAALANNGIISGSNGKYRPNDPVKRGQMAKMLVNGFEIKSNSSWNHAPFDDIRDSGFEQYIDALYEYKLTTGKTEYYFGVNDVVTRGQLAVFVHRIEQFINVEEVVFTAQQFGYEHIQGEMLFYNELTATNILHWQQSEDRQTIVIKPLAEGKQRFFIAKSDATLKTSEQNYDSEAIHYYEIDIKKVNGELQYTLTELAEPQYNSAVDMHMNAFLNGTKVTAVKRADGKPLAEEEITITHETDLSYISFHQQGEYIVESENPESGEKGTRYVKVIQKDAISLDRHFSSYYTEESRYFISNEKIRSTVYPFDYSFEKFISIKLTDASTYDSETVPPHAVSNVTVVPEGIWVDIVGEGASTIEIQYENEYSNSPKESKFTLETIKFNKGYLIK